MGNNSYSSRRPAGKTFNSRSSKPSSGFSRNGRNSSGRGNRKPSFIHPSKFINRATLPAKKEIYEPENLFTDFGFVAELEKNLESIGYVKPTRIQDESIPSIMLGRDVIGLANTGTGKTAAFTLPIIQWLIKTNRSQAALIVAPTRELAMQIEDEFRKFARGLRLYSALCVGGMNIQRQISALRRRPQVIIGTPGRLKDLYQRRVLNLENIGVMVLDEADHMLDMGFLPDVRFLISKTPRDRQSLCFSATITPDIQRLLDEMLINPITVSVRTTETSEHIEQDVIEASTKEEKMDALLNLLSEPDFEKVLIFGETKHGVQRLADDLTGSNLPAEAIHGNKSQPQRQRALRAFKENHVKIMVATDVAARGLDIPHVTHVINFDQPASYSDYVHRIGRTGRAGRSGQAFTFIARRTIRSQSNQKRR